jgi:hypothetical protein
MGLQEVGGGRGDWMELAQEAKSDIMIFLFPALFLM